MSRGIRAEDSERVGAEIKPRLVEVYGCWEAASGTSHDRAAWYRILIQAAQAESSTLEQMVALCEFALAGQVNEWSEAAREAWADPYTGDVLRHCLDTLKPEDLASPERAALYFQGLRRHFRETAGVRGQRVMSSVRAVLTGSMSGPCLGIVASLLGWQRCIDRIRDGLP